MKCGDGQKRHSTQAALHLPDCACQCSPPVVPSAAVKQPAAYGLLGRLANVAVALPLQRWRDGQPGARFRQGVRKTARSSSFISSHQLGRCFGTIVDASHAGVGHDREPHGGTQTMTFFEVIRADPGSRRPRGCDPQGGNFSVCPTARERSHLARASSKHASRKHAVRKLWPKAMALLDQGQLRLRAVLGTRC